MVGTYQAIDDDGEIFTVDIPAFSLDIPGAEARVELAARDTPLPCGEGVAEGDRVRVRAARAQADAVTLIRLLRMRQLLA